MMKKRILLILLAAVLGIAMISCSTSENTDIDNSDAELDNIDGLLLADNGASHYVIVHGENAAASEITAASELQSYLKKITGAELPIVTDSTAPTKYEIIVGKTNREADGEFDREELGDDGFVIKTVEKKLWLVGGQTRGTLYSVYTFLEDYLGCRFYMADFEKIPEVNTLVLSDIAEDKQIPVFFYRDMDWVPSPQSTFQTKRKINGMYNKSDSDYGGRIYGSINHSLNYLIPVSDYYDEHPEYFSGEWPCQPCLTNPEVLKIVTESVRDYLQDYPRCTLFPISQSDNQNYCTCDNCTRVLEEENGSQAGVLLRFVNAVATELKDEFPNVTFNTFAYQYTRTAPSVTKPADNVTTVLCSIESCFSHPLSENVSLGCESYPAGGFIPTISDDLPAWAAINDSVIIWDYTTNFHNANSYYPNLTVLLENVRWFAENNVKGVYEQGNGSRVLADFTELRAYITSKILWDPYMTEEEYWGHVDEFLEAFYGPGWTYIREYIDMAEECSDEFCFSTYGTEAEFSPYFSRSTVHLKSWNTLPDDLTEEMIRNYEDVDWSKYWFWFEDIPKTTYLETGREYFDNAIQAAETDEQKARLEKASLQVDAAESDYRYQRRNLVGTMGLYLILKGYFTSHTDMFTSEEQNTITNEILAFAEKQILDSDVAFNEALRANLVDFGITTVQESGYDISDPSKLNLANFPRDWNRQ